MLDCPHPILCQIRTAIYDRLHQRVLKLKDESSRQYLQERLRWTRTQEASTMNRMAWLLGRPLQEDTQTPLNGHAQPNTLQLLQDCAMWADFMDYVLITHRVWCKLKGTVPIGDPSTTNLETLLLTPDERLYTPNSKAKSETSLRKYYGPTPSPSHQLREKHTRHKPNKPNSCRHQKDAHPN